MLELSPEHQARQAICQAFQYLQELLKLMPERYQSHLNGLVKVNNLSAKPGITTAELARQGNLEMSQQLLDSVNSRYELDARYLHLLRTFAGRHEGQMGRLAQRLSTDPASQRWLNVLGKEEQLRLGHYFFLLGKAASLTISGEQDLGRAGPVFRDCFMAAIICIRASMQGFNNEKN